MNDVRVNVRGLRELVGAFRAVDSELPKELKGRLKAVAEHVVGVVQQRMPFISGEAAASLKPRATQKGAGIAYPAGKGVYKAAYYPWLDWGGTTGKGHRVGSPFSGSVNRDFVGKEGRYLYPAIGESRGYISEKVDDALEETIKDAGFTTTGHV